MNLTYFTDAVGVQNCNKHVGGTWKERVETKVRIHQKKYCYLSGDNFFYRLHPASHGFAFDCVQELVEFRQ